jgi:hypothetical protein
LLESPQVHHPLLLHHGVSFEVQLLGGVERVSDFSDWHLQHAGNGGTGMDWGSEVLQRHESLALTNISDSLRHFDVLHTTGDIKLHRTHRPLRNLRRDLCEFFLLHADNHKSAG